MKAIINKSKLFLNSYYYPIFIGCLVLFGHTFSIEVATSILLLISAGIGLMVCDDLKILISPLIMFIFAFSQKNVSSEMYYSKSYIIAIIATSIIIVALLVFHFVYYRKNISFKPLTRSKVSLGIALFCVSLLLNGVFSSNSYSSKNIFFALITIISLGLIYFLFQINLNNDSSLKKYLFFVLYVASMVLTLELYLSFINQIQIVDGSIVKESVLFGWGMWNNMGGMLAFFLPVHIYFATTSKKFGYLFYFSAIASYIAIVLTLSRSSLLVSSIVLFTCIICSCFLGVNKRTNRIITAILAALAILGIIVMWNKLAGVLGDYLNRGLDDNGRFEIYKHGFNRFLKSPVFGGGFATDFKLDYEFITFIPFRYHNTIIQLLSACGIVGLLAYLYHRYTTVMMLLKRKNIFSLFSAFCIASLLLCSLLDNHFFNIYPLFGYSLILVINEKCNN